MALKLLDDELSVLVYVSEGNHRAFCQLFDHYHPYVYGFARKLTRSDEQAEEIVQDIFVKIWVNKAQLPAIHNFAAYLTQLVRNQAYTVLRKQMRQVKAYESMSNQTGEKQLDLDRQLDFRETQRILDEAVAGLSPQQQRVYHLCHQQGLKYEDAANELGISVDTVRFHMKAALKSIRNHFVRYGFAYMGIIFRMFQ
ncbi:RNA polymerase sigma-70 factor [Olivibacter sitiensis]|uniref:RNA polymerase sigma-70 factor n=1 Tax=Olivibacter sitiensis TaxID=376470 RepID=UPI000420EEDF|nr:RNA polymerase sigma-70 factor [Olivibacter sitiensis]